jgi:hypothetical protein
MFKKILQGFVVCKFKESKTFLILSNLEGILLKDMQKLDFIFYKNIYSMIKIFESFLDFFNLKKRFSKWLTLFFIGFVSFKSKKIV